MKDENEFHYAKPTIFCFQLLFCLPTMCFALRETIEDFPLLLFYIVGGGLSLVLVLF
jgi:hypothetical protein